jgi:hypothetical protein
MSTDQASHSLLAHFDRPKTIDCPDFEWEETPYDPREAVFVITDHVAPDQLTQSNDDDPQPLNTLPQRGVLWVLMWAAALAVFGVVVCIATEFVCLAMAANALGVAARAGALEATLPRATHDTVAAVIERRLAGYPQLAARMQFTLLRNDAPVDRSLRLQDGDRISIAISAPASAALPTWLQRLPQFHDDAPLIAQAERQLPSHKLRPN